ncbi:MAG: hypothetical protein HYS06_02395 [Methylocystis sp.]|nr:hypothetical protein [Methylocystis sp.]MBI3275597.1 hypothetical protein [Methylocystis sp.]
MIAPDAEPEWIAAEKAINNKMFRRRSPIARAIFFIPSRVAPAINDPKAGFTLSRH